MLACDAIIAHVLDLAPIGGGVIWALIGWLLWSILGPIVVLIALELRRRYRGAKFIAGHCVMPLVMSLAHSILYFVVRTLITGQPGADGESVLDAWTNGLPVAIELDILVYVLTVVGVHAALSLRAMQARESEKEELQRQIGRAELELLKMQIPERLLMSMLTRIETLVILSLERAEALINQLSHLLRSTLSFTTAKRSLREEVELARHFASAAASVRKAPFVVSVLVSDETSSVLPATKLMLPLLVSIWSDTAEDESPHIATDAVISGNSVRVIWKISGVRDTTRLRSFVETARVRLPPNESISVRNKPNGLSIAYERPAEADQDATQTSAPAAPATSRRPPRRRPTIVTLLAVLTLYPPAEQFIAGLVALAVAAIIGAPFPDSAFVEVGTAAVATPAGVALAWIAYRQRYRPQRKTILLALAIGAIIGPLACMAIFSAVIALVRAYPTFFADVLRSQIAASYRTDDFLIFFSIAIGALAYGRQLASEERRLENQALDEQLARTHAQALKEQLNPHFVFNALNSILALADRNCEAAGAMTARLREYFGLVAGMAERQLVPLHEELHFTETYLDIEKVRFGERLNVSMDVEPAARSGLVPNLLLQPLIENSVRHGLEPRQGGSVFITAAKERDDLVITVRDDGPGLRVPPRQEGIGLQNVRNRLRQLHGTAFTMNANDHARGFSVLIRLPFRT